MRNELWLPIAAAISLLGGCGGGERVSTTPPPPAPPLPPAPPPNTSFADLRNSQAFQADAASSTVAFNLTSKTTINGSASAGPLTVNYDATKKSYTVMTPGRSQAFAPDDIQPSADGETVYEKKDGTNSDRLTLLNLPYGRSEANEYVRMGYWQQNAVADGRQDTVFDIFTYGFDTPAAAVPRSGSASFDVDVFGLATTPGFEPRVFEGQGNFDVDFFAGIFSTNTYLTETGLLSGDSIVGGGLQLTGAGRLSASDGKFSGNILYGGVNARLAGTMSGRFYGPAAQELGASFTAGNADGSTVAGSMTGRRGTDNPAVNLTLTNLVTPQRFYTKEALLTVRSFDGQSGIDTSFMRLGSNIYLQTSDNLTYGPGISSLPYGAFTTTSLVPSADSNFTAYEKIINEQPVRLELYRPGPANRELALTYMSFGRWSSTHKNGVVNEASRVFFTYGLETPAGLLSARTGNARYAGVVYGAGANRNTGATYDISGTSQFDVNFSDQSYTAALALVGSSTNGGGIIDFGGYDFTGQLSSVLNEHRAVFTHDNGNYGELTSSFFGPDGEEIGGPFTLMVPPGRPGAGTAIAGVTVAKRGQ